MARLTPLHLLPLLIAAASHAAEITIEQTPFSIDRSFNAVALPIGPSVLIRVSPEKWTDFQILEIAAHGSRVAKDDLLVRFDAEEIDRKLVNARRAVESDTITFQQAELDQKLLVQTAPDKLEALKRAAGIAKEENTYFTEVRRKTEEDSADQALKRSKQMLANQREELRQLGKMYEADDVTEETEEIILVRQQDAVASAEFALRMETLNLKRTLDVSLPREGKVLADRERDTAIALKIAEQDIPRSIELGKLKLDELKTTRQRAADDLAALEKDRKLFEIKATADGIFYYGAIADGRWTTSKIIEALVPHGRPPAHAAFATFLPGTAPLELVAFVDDATARSLQPEISGIATLAGREDVEIPVKLAKLANVPQPDGSYRADFTATWPETPVAAAGATAKVRVVCYQQEAAMVIPSKALAFGPTGWTVEVKLADGKTERRPVKRGRDSGEKTEILSGLEPGQVILVP
jgi:HlyD family secretion protein